MARVDRESSIPAFRQIAEAIRWQIATGSLTPGDSLPSTRQAAGTWGVNRHTVHRAYRELVVMGLLSSVPPQRMRVTDASPKIHASSGRRLEGFLDRVLEEALFKHGLSPRTFASHMNQRATREQLASERVTVVECNPVDCSDLCRQLESRWSVEGLPFLLGDRREPVAGPIVATIFHFQEVRELWPHRSRDIRFVATAPDSRLRDAFAQAVRGKKPARVTIVADRDATTVRNVAADVVDLLSEWKLNPKCRVFSEPWSSKEALKGRGVLLAAPRVWHLLPAPDREHPRILQVRYVIDENDLEFLGHVFGWRRSERFSRQWRPRTAIVEKAS